MVDIVSNKLKNKIIDHVQIDQLSIKHKCMPKDEIQLLPTSNEKFSVLYS